MRIKFIVLSLILGFLMSCNKDDPHNDECIHHGIAYVISVDPETFTGVVNEPVSIEVQFPVYNGCGGFGEFLVTKNGNIRIIEVKAKYTGCICTQNIPIITTHYEFIAEKPGEYELKFKSGPGEYISVNLYIN